MSDLASRIASARKAKNLNQSELARLLDLKPQAVQSWESGKATPKSNRIQDLCRALGVNPAYLLGDDDSSTTPLEHFHEVSVIEVASLLPGNAPVVIGSQLLLASEMTSKGVCADDAVCIQVSGNGLSPVIHHKSIVGIDRKDREVVDGFIYAIAHQNEIRLKAISRLPGSALCLSSFNRARFDDETYSAAEIQEQGIIVLGRVFWVSQFLP